MAFWFEYKMQPIKVKLHKNSKTVELQYSTSSYQLSFELLRVLSPSAEVRGHGVGQEVLQVGKSNVMIVGVEPIGHYALRFDFDDGHNSGIYSWQYLYKLATEQDQLWSQYLQQLEQAGQSRIEDSINFKSI